MTPKTVVTLNSYTIDFVEAVTRYSDLEGWWKFDGNLNDLSGNGRNGAMSIPRISKTLRRPVNLVPLFHSMV